MLKKLLEAFVSVSGSHRTDVRYESRRIARRCTIGFELSGDQAFRSLGTRSLLIHQAAEDPNAVKQDQLSSTIELLKAMASELQQLEASSGLRDRITEAYRAESASRRT